MEHAPTPEATEAARMLIAGTLKNDRDSIAAALTVPLEAWFVDTHREVMRATRALVERGVTKPEFPDFISEVDKSICGPMELSVLTEPRTSENPKARAETLRADYKRRLWASKAESFAIALPALTPDAACAEFGALMRSVEVTADGWPVPEPLPDTAHAVEPFTPELLPDVFRDYVTDAAERMQCPLDFVAVAIMVTLGSVVGRQVGICPKKYDTWLEVPNLWGGIVGTPGTKKSPAMQPAMNILARLDAQARKAFDTALEGYNRAMEVHTHRIKAAKKAATKAAEDGGDEDAIRSALDTVKNNCFPPVRRRYWTNDPTVEKLGELLRDNPNGLLVFRDELTGWLRTLDRDGHESDRPFYLEAWNGTGRFTYDRIGRGTVEIDAACVSILGGIQPGPLKENFRSALHNGAGADGLLQRFQLLVWPDVSKGFCVVDRCPNVAARNAALAVFQRLNAIDASDIGVNDDDRCGGIPFLRFADDAQPVFDGWQLEHNTRLRAGNDGEPFVGHLAKFESTIPALALLIHLVEAPNGGPVSRVALDRALAWAKYLESHARRVYGSCVRGDLDAARALLRLIEGGDLRSPFTAKDVYRKHRAGLSRREDVEAALALLEDHGWVRGHKVDTGGRPTVHYMSHPSLRKAG